MKKHFVQKLLCLTLSVCFFCANIATLSANTTTTRTEVALPSSVPTAPSKPAEVPSSLTYDGVTYYNADSKNFISSPQLFIKDLLSAKRSGTSLLSAWNSIGYALSNAYGSWPDHTNQTSSLMQAISYLSHTSVKNGSDYSAINDTWDCYNPTAQIAYSMADAQNKIRNDLFSWYRTAGGRRKPLRSKSNSI